MPRCASIPQRLAPVDVPADTALTALAFAEAPGLPLELWRAAVEALGAGHLTTQQLARFARSPAASFLVEIESSTDSGIAVFRLFHQALNDALLHAREQIAVPADDQAALTQAFTTIGEQHGWDHASSYLLRSLPAHAAAAGMIDALLTDDAYLLHADLHRLIPLADHATSQPGHQRSRLLRLTPRAIIADPPVRTALFSVTETLDHLGHSYTTSSFPAPYRAIWATAMPRMERSLLEGHTDWVRVLCAFTLDGRSCWPAAATTARCGSGTRPPASRAPSWPATPAGSVACAPSPRTAEPAGHRRRRRDGADLGPGHRHPARHPGPATPTR